MKAIIIGILWGIGTIWTTLAAIYLIEWIKKIFN